MLSGTQHSAEAGKNQRLAGALRGRDREKGMCFHPGSGACFCDERLQAMETSCNVMNAIRRLPFP
jgi:hypothetical protein